MKKLTAAICAAMILITAFGATTGVCASAAKERNEDVIRALCLEDKRVKDAVCVTLGSTCGIILRCEALYFAEDKNEVKSNVLKKVKERFPAYQKVCVKMDLDLFLRGKKVDDKLKAGTSVLELKDEILEILRLASVRN